MKLLFQDYFVLGSLTISGIGATMFILDRNRLYSMASMMSILGFFFPFFFVIVLSYPLELVDFGTRFDIFLHGPPLLMMILDLLWAYPTFLGGLRGKRLAINYLLLGTTTFMGGIYAWPALFSFTLSMSGAAIFGAVGTNIYLAERAKEMRIREILDFMTRKGNASLEEVMQFMGISDVEADRLLYEMWSRDLIERISGKETVYEVKHKR